MIREIMRDQAYLLPVLAGLLILGAVPVSAEQDPMGYFEVTSNPQGADVFIDDIFAGETPVIVPVRSSGMNGSVIRLIQQGFQPWEQAFPTAPAPGMVIPVQATMVPVSTVGSLKVTSNPSGALVSVNNGNGQMTPWTYQNLPAGNHLVSIILMGFEPFIRTVEIQPGRMTDLVANMTPRTGAGTLEIKSEPGGASAYVDGVYAGVTNLVVGNVPPGRHEVRVSRAGSEDYIVWVTVADKQITPVMATLSPAHAASGGSVVVTTEPPGASVFMDGTFSGVTETGRPLEITNLTPGSHRIFVSGKNYEDYEAVTMVSGGSITPVNIRMNPSPMPQACGVLMLTSDPAGAEIVIDGQMRGTTPATIDTVCSGRHTYSLSLPGYQEYRSSFEMIPGQVLQVNTVLLAEAPTQDGSPRTPGPAPFLLAGALAISALLISRREG